MTIDMIEWRKELAKKIPSVSISINMETRDRKPYILIQDYSCDFKEYVLFDSDINQFVIELRRMLIVHLKAKIAFSEILINGHKIILNKLELDNDQR